MKKTTKKFIDECILVHGNKYNYSKVNYTGNKNKVIIICKNHGEFLQVPTKHLFSKQGCPTCGGRLKSNTIDFIKKSKKIHGEKYNYSLVDYKNKSIKVKIICKKHGIFEQIPHNHLWEMSGCPKCSKSQKSYIEQEWLDSLNIPHLKRNISIKINKKLIKVDGFDEKTNTIYEFYGDFYHGNPKYFDSIDKNVKSKKFFHTLYNDTKYRESLIKNAGYNLITIWESDFMESKGIKYYKKVLDYDIKYWKRQHIKRYYESLDGDDLVEDYSWILKI